MNRYEILAFLPAWLRYLPICLAIFIAAAKTAYIITLKVRKKTYKITNDGFGVVLILQIIHYFLIARDDMLFFVSVIALTICYIFCSVFIADIHKLFFCGSCTFAIYLIMECKYIYTTHIAVICGFIIILLLLTKAIIKEIDYLKNAIPPKDSKER